MSGRLGSLAFIVGALAIVSVACQTQQKVVRYKPFLANLQGATTGTQAVGDAGMRHDPTVVAGDMTVIEHPDGSKTLLAKTIRQLMAHLLNTMDEGDDDLLFEQVVSELAKGEYRVRDKDPYEILDYLYDHERDIKKMFNRMPMGEYSPTVLLTNNGENGYVVRLTGAAAKDCRFTRLWVVMEQGNWRLLWID